MNEEPKNTPQNSPKTGLQDQGKPWRFRKGVSGNPGGRPKAANNFGAEVRAFLQAAHPDAKSFNEANAKKGGKDVLKTRLDILLRRMEKDDPKTLLHYAYGKPIETHELSGVDGGEIPVLILKHAHELLTPDKAAEKTEEI